MRIIITAPWPCQFSSYSFLVAIDVCEVYQWLALFGISLTSEVTCFICLLAFIYCLKKSF